MPSFIAKQPNGRYCRYSTIVDCPTAINMTRDDYIDYCMHKARLEAIDVLDNYVKPFSQVEEWFRPGEMTQEEFDKIKVEMSLPANEDLIWRFT